MASEVDMGTRLACCVVGLHYWGAGLACMIGLDWHVHWSSELLPTSLHTNEHRLDMMWHA